MECSDGSGMSKEQQAMLAYVADVLRQKAWDATRLAKEAGVAPSTIYRPLNQKDWPHSFTLKTLQKIALASGIPIPEPIAKGTLSTGSPQPIIANGGNLTVLPKSQMSRQTSALPAPFVGDMPRDVPVLGVAAGATMDDLDSDTFSLNGEVVDYARRPAGILNARDAFCIWVVGSSMEPRFKPGALLYLSPSRPASNGDDVVVELLPKDPHEPKLCILKELIGRSRGHLVLTQHSPKREVRVPANRVVAIYKVLDLKELLGI